VTLLLKKKKGEVTLLFSVYD